LLIEAANGIGKTITSLSALLPIVKEKKLTLIYVTRTHTQMDRVIEELEMINSKNNLVIGLTFKGKSEMCLNSEVNKGTIKEITDLCGQLRKNGNCKYFKNLKNFNQIPISGRSEELISLGEKFQICPYYYAKNLLKNTDVIITTFNYLIHPFIRQIFFKDIDKLMSDCIILFDEGHNIIDVAREAGTSSITPRSIKRALDELIGILLDNDNLIINFLESIKTFIETTGSTRIPKNEEEIEIAVKKSIIKKIYTEIPCDNIEELLDQMIEKGLKVRDLMLQNNKLPRSSLYSVSSFVKFLYKSLFDPQYIHEILVYKKNNKTHTDFLIKTLDIRPILSELFTARNIVVLSGTLAPIRAFRDICGFPKTNVKECNLPSPFPYENIEIYGMEGINLSYENRNEITYRFIKNICLEIIEKTPFNTGIFCASYTVLNGLIEQGLKTDVENLNIKFYREYKNFNSKDNEKMINEYKSLPSCGKKGVLIGVSGGRNSEGVDFPGKEMSSVVIVGIPLAMISYSTKKLIKYFQQIYGEDKGLDYAYYIPAIRKANQTAGRPIRKLDDKGMIIFLDDRIFWKKYYRLLSDWIKDRLVKINCYEGLFRRIVENFYKKHNLILNNKK